jgi:ethanolamine utilization protein EutM
MTFPPPSSAPALSTAPEPRIRAATVVDPARASLIACVPRRASAAATIEFRIGGPFELAREALGLIETRGWVAAVEAADAMCKTADVRLTRYEVVTDGLVTVVVRGGIAEVESAVAAGARAAERVGERVASHVIPAPDPEIEQPIVQATGATPAP